MKDKVSYHFQGNYQIWNRILQDIWHYKTCMLQHPSLSIWLIQYFSYRQKALSDLDAVKSRVRNLLREIDMPEDTVPDKMIEDFCKNAAHIQLLRYRTLRDEYVTAPSKETIGMLVSMIWWPYLVWFLFSTANTIQMDENLYYYLIFRAAERYFDKHGRYPGKSFFIHQWADDGIKLIHQGHNAAPILPMLISWNMKPKVLWKNLDLQLTKVTHSEKLSTTCK